MKLFFREISGDSSQPALVFLHGLFGSSANWQSIARRLPGKRRIIIPDLRNHGKSPHDSSCRYEDMTADLVELLDDLQLDNIDLVGHSMGGKVAMWLALNFSERVHKLVVADIAPVSYGRGFEDVFEAMLRLPLMELADRQQADRLLSESIPDAPVRAYLLQNLVRDDGTWRWRINLPALAAGIGDIRGFPEPRSLFEEAVLFLRGADSSYVLPAFHERILSLFPHAAIETIESAGHWLYAEQPGLFRSHLQQFFHLD